MGNMKIHPECPEGMQAAFLCISSFESATPHGMLKPLAFAELICWVNCWANHKALPTVWDLCHQLLRLSHLIEPFIICSSHSIRSSLLWVPKDTVFTYRFGHTFYPKLYGQTNLPKQNVCLWNGEDVYTMLLFLGSTMFNCSLDEHAANFCRTIWVPAIHCLSSNVFDHLVHFLLLVHTNHFHQKAKRRAICHWLAWRRLQWLHVFVSNVALWKAIETMVFYGINWASFGESPLSWWLLPSNFGEHMMPRKWVSQTWKAPRSPNDGLCYHTEKGPTPWAQDIISKGDIVPVAIWCHVHRKMQLT